MSNAHSLSHTGWECKHHRFFSNLVVEEDSRIQGAEGSRVHWKKGFKDSRGRGVKGLFSYPGFQFIK